LEEGAKKEGKLTHYSSGQQAIAPVNEAFEKKYPFIKVTTWRAGSTQQSAIFDNAPYLGGTTLLPAWPEQ